MSYNFGYWIIKDALKRNPCVKVSEFPDELTCIVYDESDNALEWHVYVPKGSKCSECKERQGYYLDAETIRNQQERIAELERERGEWQFKFCKEAGLHVSHVFQRDALIRDMARELRGLNDGGIPTDCMEHERRMRELGIKVQL